MVQYLASEVDKIFTNNRSTQKVPARLLKGT